MKIKHKILLICLIIAGFASMFLSTDYTAAMPPKINPSPSDYSTGMTWEKAQKLNKPIVINFYVDWCHYCKGFAPVLDKLRQQYGSKYTFVFANCEDPKNKALLDSFKIHSYPSLFLVDKNKHKKIQVDNSKFHDIKLLNKELDKFLK